MKGPTSMKFKLYYGSGSCSMSCEIAAEEAKFARDSVLIDFDIAEQAAEIEKLNPQGALPVAMIDGKVVTQNIAILEHIADKSPSSHLLAAPGTWERAETMRWLSFTASDLHKSFSPLFGLKNNFTNTTTQADVRNHAITEIHNLFAVAEKQLAGKDYLTGKNFTVADCYFYVVTSWTKWVDISIANYPNLSAYMKRVTERPAVAKVLKQAGLA